MNISAFLEPVGGVAVERTKEERQGRPLEWASDHIEQSAQETAGVYLRASEFLAKQSIDPKNRVVLE